MSIVLSEPEVIVKVGPRQTSQTKQNAIQWQDEGSNLGNKEVDEVDFVGSGVTATRSGNKLTVTISSGGGASAWGGITGTLSDQTDLQAALDAKSPTVMLCLHGDNTASITLANQPNTEQPLGNTTRSYARFNATRFNQVRVSVRVITGSSSANSPRLYPQYSTTLDGSGAWTTIGTGTGTESASISSAIMTASDWIDLPSGAKADVVFRAAQHGGDGVQDPLLANVYLEFRT